MKFLLFSDLHHMPGVFMGTTSAYRMKAASARPVAMANRPPSAMKYSSAFRFPSDRGGIGSPVRSAGSVWIRVLSKSLASKTPVNFPISALPSLSEKSAACSADGGFCVYSA